ncbi:MAG: hypothetical protein N2438_08920 [Limisphaera sp.]|nr:hypothetical protein [Limisphaera sp.]
MKTPDKVQMAGARAAAGRPRQWYESLDTVVEKALEPYGPEVAGRFLQSLTRRLIPPGQSGFRPVSPPYINTIPHEEQRA